MASATYTQLLRENKDFRRLWTGQLISELGTWFSFVGELGLVRMYSGSPLATMTLLISRLLPFLIVAPFAGVLVDRHSRKRMMLTGDLCQAVVALGYLAVRSPNRLWIVYLCGAAMSSLSIMFEAAKNAALPNLVTSNQMLTANVMVYSTRFLQLTLGAALGGLTAARFGYSAAFVVNSISFLASASFVRKIDGRKMRKQETSAIVTSGSSSAMDFEYDRADPGYRPTDLLEGTRLVEGVSEELHAHESAESNGAASGSSSFQRVLRDLREGMSYIWATPFVRALILANIGWATGGGMINLLYDRIGGHLFAKGDRGDWSVAALYTAAGAGLCIGMALARQVGDRLSTKRSAGLFIGGALLLYGLVFAVSGVMPSLYPMALCVCMSRVILGLEFGVHETFMMRVLPDDLRGRVFTTDRSLELAMVTVSMMATGVLLTRFDPRTLMVASGLLSAVPGAAWLLALGLSGFTVPERALAIGEDVAEPG